MIVRRALSHTAFCLAIGTPFALANVLLSADMAAAWAEFTNGFTVCALALFALFVAAGWWDDRRRPGRD